MPNFFEYPKLIIEELNNLGYDVDFFDDRPSTNAFVKAAIRINRNLIDIYIKKYFNNILKKIGNKKYDVVFLISGQSLSFSEGMISQLRKEQKQAKFYLYQWDSLENFPYIERMEKYFDKCFTFDPIDAREKSNLNFLPLFYSKEYEKISEKGINNLKNDFCFIGTAHPQKYKFIKQMSKELLQVYPRQYIYFFFPSRIVYIYRKLTSRELKNAKMSDFNYKALSIEKVKDIYMHTKCVLDSPQSGQKGLTIRVLEAVGAKKKLITSNKDVVNYDFYQPENIYVYDEKKGFDFNNPFFKQEYKDIKNDIYTKYSLRSWLMKILNK